VRLSKSAVFPPCNWFSIARRYGDYTIPS